MLTAGIRSSWDTQDGIRQTGTLQAQGDGTADVIISNDKTFMSTSNDVTSYAMSVVGIDTDSYELKYTGMYIHKGTKRARKARRPDFGLLRHGPKRCGARVQAGGASG